METVKKQGPFQNWQRKPQTKRGPKLSLRRIILRPSQFELFTLCNGMLSNGPLIHFVDRLATGVSIISAFIRSEEESRRQRK